MKRGVSALLSLVLLLCCSATACAASPSENGYSDVPENAWYAEAVQYLTGHGIMNGTGNGLFSPDDTLTRAMTATVLYRAAGEPAVSGEDSFSDTQPGTWYSDAVVWAAAEGLVEGYGNGLFGTNDPVTQEQLVTILWRYAGQPSPSGTADAGDASTYAAEAVRWAREQNYINEVSNTFNPRANAARAQIADILYRFLSDAKSGRPAGTSGEAAVSIPQTGWTEPVPAEYLRTSSHPGTVERLDYATKDYAGDGSDITKTAYVYLPYGYDEADTETRYDIMYLMHGWGGSAGEYFHETQKNMFDNLIERGDMKPTIFVSATFYHEGSSRDFSASIQQFRAFHEDFENALMPAVEGKYHTYAKSTSDADLKTSRDHRGFGGFSLGSVTTWLQLCYDYDYIRYFAPMSGSCWYYGTYGDFQIERNVDFIEQLVKDNDLDARGYFIYHAVGTNDAVKSQSIDMADEMLSREIFTPEHYVFYQKDGGYHDFEAVQEYLYHALPMFFPGQETAAVTSSEPYTASSRISDVKSNPAFGDYGRLLFPVNSGYWSGDTLGDLRLTWYNYIDPDKTVEIVNTLKSRAAAGETIFYDIYTDAEQAADPAKRDTGLFFFKGDEGAPFAICNAGGGFAYVGAMHDSFPHALELSKLGYNAFALIYRPGWETAMEDLGRAITFIEDNAAALGVDPDGYSLWGGSAGARMAATLGNADYLRYYTGRDDIPQASAIIMQYTGHSEASRTDAPTYACCGTSDGIASYRTMRSRLNTLQSYGIPTEFHSYTGLPHGFGIGTGTVAEGWLSDAVAFWETNMGSVQGHENKNVG